MSAHGSNSKIFTCPPGNGTAAWLCAAAGAAVLDCPMARISARSATSSCVRSIGAAIASSGAGNGRGS